MEWIKRVLQKPFVRVLTCVVCVSLFVGMMGTVAWAWYSGAIGSGSNILLIDTWITEETTASTEETTEVVEETTGAAQETTASTEETTGAAEETTEAVEETTESAEETTEAVEETTEAAVETTEAVTYPDGWEGL